MKKQPHHKLALSRTTLRPLDARQLARVGGGEDTYECVYDQDPGTTSGGGATNFPHYCSLVYSVCC